MFHHPHGVSVRMIGEVFEHLLMAAIADPDANIRQAVLSSFRPHFDPFLCQAENLRLVFLALHDETFRVREVWCLLQSSGVRARFGRGRDRASGIKEMFTIRVCIFVWMCRVPGRGCACGPSRVSKPSVCAAVVTEDANSAANRGTVLVTLCGCCAFSFSTSTFLSVSVHAALPA